MRSRIIASGLVCVLLGLAVFSWKIFVLDLPIFPDEPEGLWQVGLHARGVPSAEVASLQAAMPSPSAYQFVFGEQFTSGRLRLGVRDGEEDRRAVWRGTGEAPFAVDFVFRVQLNRFAGELPLREAPLVETPEAIREAFLSPSAGLPFEVSQVVELLDELDLPPPDDVGGMVRSLYAFVVHETRSGRWEDPLLVLQDREGSALGRERLLVMLLRGAGIAARVVRGLELAEPTPRARVWCEVWLGEWLPISATNRFLGELPAHFLTLSRKDQPLVSGTNLESIEYEFEAIRERLSPQELAMLMSPSEGIFATISLHQLPTGLQAALRVLLLMPLGALLLTVLRNVVGFPSYGTFMPMLIALALRGTGLAVGLALVALVLAIGVGGRLFVTHLRLLLVPRLSLLLCIVVATVTGLALAGFKFEERDFYAGMIFPIVILTMLVERFSITLSEEGLQPAALRAGSSIVLAIGLYPIFRSPVLEHIMFSFPEWVLVEMGLLIWLGGYTGYRVTDILRFRRAVAKA